MAKNQRSRYWLELTTREIAALPAETIAILPTGAVEQHGPHLPVGTDAYINRGIIARMLEMAPSDLPLVILPEQTIGTSHEHLGFPGTLSHTPAEIMQIWTTALAGALRAGVHKVMLFNSHGGQVHLLQPTALMLRQQLSAQVFFSSWFDAGYPEGMFDAAEEAFGIHAGDIETSMMLHLYPQLVVMDQIADFPSAAAALETEFTLLQTDPGSGRMGGFGWMMQDLQPTGAAGNARNATAERGEALVDRAAQHLLRLVQEIRYFGPDRLVDTTFLGPRKDR